LHSPDFACLRNASGLPEQFPAARLALLREHSSKAPAVLRNAQDCRGLAFHHPVPVPSFFP
jgi:hypothetical protein